MPRGAGAGLLVLVLVLAGADAGVEFLGTWAISEKSRLGDS